MKKNTKNTRRLDSLKLKYRVMNPAGELLGYVNASDEGDAYRKAKLKYGSILTVKMV